MKNNKYKVCKTCNERKEINEFYGQKKQNAKGEEYIYYHSQCKECKLKEMSENKDIYTERDKKYRKNNPIASRNASKNWRNKNKEKASADQKRWRQENKEKIKEYQEKYKSKQFKISTKQWKSCKEYFNNCCAYCGISEEKAKELFNKGLNKEHAINEGMNDLSNCVPSCTGCNSHKNKDDYTYWYTPDNTRYDVERYILIEKWLKEDYKNFI